MTNKTRAIATPLLSAALGALAVLGTAACLPDAPIEPTPQVTQAPAVVIHEDDPGFDCRSMGNHQCGVEVQGTWYVLNFDTNSFVPR